LIGSLVAPMTSPPPDVTALNPRVPPQVADIVARALRPDPAERFGSAAEMLDAIARARAALAEKTTALVAADRVKPRARRIPRRAALGLGLLMMLALGVPWLAPVSDWLTPAPAAGRHVIAVLPLEHLGGDGSRLWLGAGISETLGMSLSKITSVTVISRAEVVEAMRRTRDPGRVARVLGATLMVDGSIQEWQDRLRITVRLVHPNGTVQWSEAYEAPLAGIFALQADLASAVSRQLQLAIGPTEQQQTSLRLTTSPDALAEYWKGQAALERATLTSNVHAAVESFTRAISLDGNFAAAHAALANAYRVQYGEKRDPALMSRATESAARALSLDPDQPAVRVSLGTIYAGTGQYEAAEIELRHALALQPASDEAHRELATVLLQQNRPDEAIAALRRAIEIRPDYWRNHANLGLAYYRLRRLELARGAFLRAIELQPDNPASHNNMGVVYAQLGDKVRALAEFERANTLAPTRRGFANLGMYYSEAGRLDDALEAFQRALTYDTRSDVTHGNMADVLTRLGREEDARREYRQARALALELLQVNDKDAAALSRVAVFEAKLGMRDDALGHARAAIELAPRDAEVNYKLAVVQAARRERDAALASLARALEYGYSAAMAREDQDLALLRETPEFERLVSQSVTRK
jgi:tetratricopeptide (TPR) repeat protein